MPDFHQPGPVLSLPLNGGGGMAVLERDLMAWTRDRPLAVLLPCHARDLENPALGGIIEVLAGTPWVSHVLAGVDGADEAGFDRARQRFAALGSRAEVLWNGAAPAGKGRNLRGLAGHLLHSRCVFAAAMHDCDIRTYSRDFLARLCWPVLHPDAGLAVCKGYYARSGGGLLHGRVFRLLFQPLLRAAAAVSGPAPWLTFLQSFRYPLSGELCLRAGLLGQLAFDPGWGVEIRLLHSIYRLAAAGTVCQAELCEAYDHKHHESPGLERMAEEIAGTFRQTLEEEGLSGEALTGSGFARAFPAAVGRALLESQLMAAMAGMPDPEAVDSPLAALLAAAAVRGLAGGEAWEPLPAAGAQKNPEA